MKLKIESIKIPSKRLRALGDVAALAGSMRQIGQLSPVLVDGANNLIAGLHRIKAAQSLGWTHVDANVVNLDDLDARLAEIDENLIRNELTALERAEHHRERKEIMEVQEKASVKGGDRKSEEYKEKSKDNNYPLKPYSEIAAAKFGVSKASVKQDVQIAESLSDDVKAKLKGSALEDRKVDLLTLSRLPHDEQREIVARGEKEIIKAAKEIRDARRQASVATLQMSESNEWYTPKQYVDAAREVMGGYIEMDPASCAEANKTVRANFYYTEQDDGLSKPWTGTVWLNPPYGRDDDNASNQGKWATKIIEEYKRPGGIAQGVLLINAVTDRVWFKQLWDYPTCFVYGRIKFIPSDSGKAPAPTHGSAIVYFGLGVDDFVKIFSKFGRVVLPKNGISISQ